MESSATYNLGENLQLQKKPPDGGGPSYKKNCHFLFCCCLPNASVADETEVVDGKFIYKSLEAIKEPIVTEQHVALLEHEEEHNVSEPEHNGSESESDSDHTAIADDEPDEGNCTDASSLNDNDISEAEIVQVSDSDGDITEDVIVSKENEDDAGLSEANSSPMVMAKATNKSGTPSPVSQSSKKDLVVKQGEEWTGNNEEDIDRLVAIHTNRSSLSSLGLRSDSMASVYSGAGEGRYGAVTVRGQVEFRLQYNYKAGALEILIIQCKDLAAVDAKRNRSDPYVKVYLLPDKSKSGKRKTKVRKHTLNPVFDECLKFHISITGLETRTLWLTVWHSDMFGRNDFLGEVRMALENKIFDDPTPKWYNLQERTEPFEDVLSFKGDILVGLKFVPPDMTVVKKGKRSRGTLHVKVKEAKSLTAVKSNGTSDPFCKSYLLPDKGRTSKQKTAVIRKTINAVWNHTFLYDDVTLQELAERCLELTVWDHDRLGSNEFLGGVRFSLGEGKYYGKSVDWMDSTGKEVSLWKSMLERPNFWVEGCLPLRPTLDYRTS